MSNFLPTRIEIDSEDFRSTIPILESFPKSPLDQCLTCNYLQNSKCSAYKAEEVLRLRILYTLAQHNKCPLHPNSSSGIEDFIGSSIRVLK